MRLEIFETQLSFTSSGTVDEFTSRDREVVRVKVAELSNVNVGDVTIKVASGSVVVTAIISATSQTAARRLANILSSRLTSPVAATKLLGVQVTSTPSASDNLRAIIVLAPAPPPPPPSSTGTGSSAGPPPPPPEDSTGLRRDNDSSSLIIIIAAGAGAGAGALVCLGCIVYLYRRMRRKAAAARGNGGAAMGSSPASPSGFSHSMQQPSHAAPEAPWASITPGMGELPMPTRLPEPGLAVREPGAARRHMRARRGCVSDSSGTLPISTSCILGADAAPSPASDPDCEPEDGVGKFRL